MTERDYLEAVVESLSDGVVACDSQGRITIFNKMMREMHGLPVKAVPIDQLAQYFDVYEEDGRTLCKTDDLPLVRALRGEIVQNVALVIAPKDRPRRLVSVNARQLRDHAGGWLGAVAVVRDVGEKRDLDSLRHSEARLRALVESAPNAMVMVNETGCIELVNAQTESLFGYERHELLGKQIQELVPQAERSSHAEHVKQFFAKPSARKMGQNRNLFGRRRDGVAVPIEVGLSPFETPDGIMVLAVIVDITSRVAAERALRESVAEKETLLQEIHHRVKNNLQVICSLLYLQARHAADVDVQRVLIESQVRVRAMALIHQLLYEHKDFSRIRLQEYLSQLINLIAATFSNSATNIRLKTHFALPEVHIDLHRAIPCGLIITELVTNAFKHAFPPPREGEITVELNSAGDDEIEIVVADNGVGMPESAQLGSSTSLGLQLVPMLAEQVGAHLTMRNDHGARFQLRFKPATTKVEQT